MTAIPADGMPPPAATNNRVLATLQRIGRSLMLPIAVLPAAALLLRFGQDDMLGGYSLTKHADIPGQSGLHLATYWHQLEYVAQVFGAAGNALFSNLPLLFAIGVAIGFARRSDGATALAAAVGYLVFNAVSMVIINLNGGFVTKLVTIGYWTAPGQTSIASNPTYVIGGIVTGITAALLYQRYYRIKLPPYLAFFGGRRFVPIVTAFASVVNGVILGVIWPYVGTWIFNLGGWMGRNQTLGAGIFGFVNRLLLPFGLHHVVNNVAWFTIGSYHGVNGDLNRFFAGDKSAGMFMTGFFPIMMFALPAAALAMTRAARPEQRKLVGGILLSAALCSFLTGVTEPIEFAFLFIAPWLFAIHAVLTGVSLAVCQALGVHDGFGFSAGLIDYVINWNIAQKPWMILIIGPIFGVIYYALFTFAIKRFNIMTPGRELDADTDAGIPAASAAPATPEDVSPPAAPGGLAPAT